jgi:hypothetical protein
MPLRLKIARVFDGMESGGVRGASLRSGDPHVGEAFGGSILDLGRPRRGGKIEHRLIDILVIAVCAVIAGAESRADIALYGRSKIDWLGTFLTLPDGIPAHDTFRRGAHQMRQQLSVEEHFWRGHAEGRAD